MVEKQRKIEEKENVEEKTITITKKEYFALRMASETLDMLENGGVDNWAHYGDCFYSDDDDELNIDKVEEEIKKEIFG